MLVGGMLTPGQDRREYDKDSNKPRDSDGDIGGHGHAPPMFCRRASLPEKSAAALMQIKRIACLVKKSDLVPPGRERL